MPVSQPFARPRIAGAQGALALLALAGSACSSSQGPGSGGASGFTSGGFATGGALAGGSGASTNTGGSDGNSATGGVSSGGSVGNGGVGGNVSTGGSVANGGGLANGGSVAGAASSTGGAAGRASTGGNVSAAGAAATGGGSAGSSGMNGGVANGGAANGGAATGGSAGASGAPCAEFAAPVALGKAEPAQLNTLSGLVASRAQPGVLYAHADRSGPRFYALTKAGRTLGDFSLTGTGAQATDWEDVAIGPGPAAGSYLYFGDVGDNAARPGAGAGRAEIQIYRVLEPTVSLTQAPLQQNLPTWQRLRFTYPDRPHDSETLMVDPKNGDFIIVTREGDGSAVVFQAPGSTPPDTPTVLVRLAGFQVGAEGANAGDISPTGDRALVRSYEAALLFVRAPGATWATAFSTSPRMLPVANEAQCEGATFGADGLSWLSSGEVDPTIYEARATCP